MNAGTFAGVTHEFFGMKGLIDEAGEAIEMAAGDLKMAFRSGSERAVA